MPPETFHWETLADYNREKRGKEKRERKENCNREGGKLKLEGEKVSLLESKDQI